MCVAREITSDGREEVNTSFNYTVKTNTMTYGIYKDCAIIKSWYVTGFAIRSLPHIHYTTNFDDFATSDW